MESTYMAYVVSHIVQQQQVSSAVLVEDCKDWHTVFYLQVYFRRMYIDKLLFYLKTCLILSMSLLTYVCTELLCFDNNHDI